MMVPVKLTLVLCDYVAVAEGKLYISGGGWTVIGPDPVPFGLAVLMEVPWDLTNRNIQLRLRMFHEDGHAVTQPAPVGPQPVELGADVEVGRPAGVVAGTALPVPLAINLPPMALPPGQGFYWEAEIDGQKHEDWRLSFRTREVHRPATDPTAIPEL
jgi:hypothetical protein